MLNFALTTVMLVAAAQPAAAAAQREEFTACLKQAVTRAAAEKVKAGAFDAYARQACAAQAAAFKQALVSFDVKQGVAKARAEEDAQLQLDDYLAGAADRFGMEVEPGGP